MLHRPAHRYSRTCVRTGACTKGHNISECSNGLSRTLTFYRCNAPNHRHCTRENAVLSAIACVHLFNKYRGAAGGRCTRSVSNNSMNCSFCSLTWRMKSDAVIRINGLEEQAKANVETRRNSTTKKFRTSSTTDDEFFCFLPILVSREHWHYAELPVYTKWSQVQHCRYC